MGSHAPSSTTLPKVRRKRKAPPPPQAPPACRFCSMDHTVMHRSLLFDRREHPEPLRKEKTMADVMGRSSPVVDAYDVVVCVTCGSGDHDGELLLCDRCERGCHTFCLRPIVAKVPIGPWFCPDCTPPVKALKRFPMKQTKIMDFFRIKYDDQDEKLAKCGPSQAVTRRRKRTLVMHKKRRRMLPFVPTEDRATGLKQMASLATALTSSKAEFTNELTYMHTMAPRSSNQARLEEEGIQVLNKEDKETLELCRTMQQKGHCPPLLVVFDPHEGFTVQADANIKDMTFIAEFAGDVDYLEKRENDDCDCMMTLLLTADPSKSLVICSDKCGNISRFISGINNHTPNGKKKQNVKCVRYDIDGESHVLLVACRDISCGERLYCDYNEAECMQLPKNKFRSRC